MIIYFSEHITYVCISSFFPYLKPGPVSFSLLIKESKKEECYLF